MRTVILRTAEEKADLVASWSRPDEEFFASGACHVLVAGFLLAYPEAGFEAWELRPEPGQRGGHLFARRQELVFDSAGYGEFDPFVADYAAAMRRIVSGWTAEVVAVADDPIGWTFCRRAGTRHPSRFLHDPMPRALAFVGRFPAPRPTG